MIIAAPPGASIIAPVVGRLPMPNLDDFGGTQEFGKVFSNAKRVPAKGLCLRHYRRRALGGISERASRTMDMGKFSVLATLRQLILWPGVADSSHSPCRQRS